MSKLAVILGSLLLLTGQFLLAGDSTFFVAVNGSDSNPGTIERPFATWQKARDAVRERGSDEKMTVYFRAGTYYLPETIVFGPEDSGSPGKPVIYAAYPGEKVVISGAKKLTDLEWKPWKNGIYYSDLKPAIDFDQLFVNGVRQIRARFPNYDYEDPLRSGSGYQLVTGGSNKRYDTWLGYDPAIFSKKKWSNPATGIVHAFQSQNWGNMQYRIKAIDRDQHRILLGEGGWQLQRAAGIGKGRGSASPFFVENIFEELDAPGEWFYHEEQQRIYYYPPSAVAIEEALVEAVVIKDLISISGTSSRPVRHIQLKGFTFTQARMTFMEEYEPLARGDWAIHRGGAVFMEGAENCTIEDCNFEFVGGNAVFMSGYNRRNTVSGCRFFHTGESAVCMVGDPAAVRLYLTWDDREIHHKSWEEMREGMDLRPGPKTAAYPEDCMIRNCIAYELGDFGKQVAGVFISMSHRIQVSHCTVYNVPRAGICINDGTWGGHIIEYCDIWETVRETGEHGPFNSWGRERFWLGAGGEGNMIRQQVLLDAIDPTIIRHNRISNFRKSVSAGNWTIDLDDGSSNYHIYNNLSLGSTLKLRDGYYRKVWNNIHVSAVPMGWHVWPEESGDEFYHNITVIAGTVPGEKNPANVFIKPIRMPAEARWGKRIDENLYYNVNYTNGQICPGITKAEWQKRGYDRHSLFTDPLFVDPEHGDYRVKAHSPALDMGFRNFPMDQFGHTMTRIVPFGGEFEKQRLVRLKPDKRGGKVYYTLDGRRPSPKSPVYRTPIKLKKTATLRAQTFKNDQPVGFETRATFTKVDKVTHPSWYQALLDGRSPTAFMQERRQPEVLEWKGATLADIAGGDMIDALGGFETGVFIAEAPQLSEAHRLGFRASDIIIQWDDRKITNIREFKELSAVQNSKEVRVTLIRGYKKVMITL